MKKLFMLLSFVAFAQATEQCPAKSEPCKSECSMRTRMAKFLESQPALADFIKGLGFGVASQAVLEGASLGLKKALPDLEVTNKVGNKEQVAFKDGIFARTGICADQVKGISAFGLSLLGINKLAKNQLNAANVAGSIVGLLLTRVIAAKLEARFAK